MVYSMATERKERKMLYFKEITRLDILHIVSFLQLFVLCVYMQSFIGTYCYLVLPHVSWYTLCGVIRVVVAVSCRSQSVCAFGKAV